MTEPTVEHDYLSTACHHGQLLEAFSPEEARKLHDYCRNMVGYQGVKRPAQCKFCDAHCSCECHQGAGLVGVKPPH
jgi:hypothetical protein